MRFQVSDSKKAKQWVCDFDSVSTTAHFEELEQVFCKSLVAECLKGQKPGAHITVSKAKQANDKYNAVRLQLTRTDGLVLQKDGFNKFLKASPEHANAGKWLESDRETTEFLIENVHRYRV